MVTTRIGNYGAESKLSAPLTTQLYLSKNRELELTKGRRQKGTSYGAQIRKLFEEGFFSKKRAAHDVQAELEKRGHKFPLGRISEALTRLTKSENLYRNKNEEGVWLFQNKHAK